MPPTRRRASQARNSASSASSLAINLPSRRLHIANNSQQQPQPAASLHNADSYEARSDQALAAPSGSQGQDVGDVESTEHVSLSLSSEVHPTSLHASWQTDAASQGRMLPPPDFAFITPEMISARGVGARARASQHAFGSAHPAHPPAARAPPRMLNRHARPRTSSASQAGMTQDSSLELSHLQAMRPPDMDFFSRPAAPPTEAASRGTRARSAQPSTNRRQSGMISEEPSTSLRSLRGVTASPGSLVRPADSSRDLDASRLSSMAPGQATGSLASPNLEESELDNEASLASDPRPFREDPGRTARLHLGLEAAYPRSRRVLN
ncbi:hypothetical protein CBOM_00893 [Ceraceosorus bombacis]|uniref:Uncharacterized protein n=1 Tax=Ceraceosorus bombacis TaxID=401625 RepID=A0A0P1BB03_9BASI|nr:hypothetical protein CBOM_00893 [Ceraceosorus bombacis]